MIVRFVGICLFDVAGSGATAYLVNGRNGTSTIPRHDPVIIVRPGTVDASNWGTPTTGPIPPLGSGDFWRFDLDGVDVAFTPAPAPTASNLSLMLHVTDIPGVFCPDLRTLNTTLNDPALVAARVVIAGGLQAFKQINGLVFSELQVADNVVVSATPFTSGPTKTLAVTGSTTMWIANIDLDVVKGDDMPHLGLYCRLLDPLAPTAPLPATSRALADVQALRFARLSRSADQLFRHAHQPGTHKNDVTLDLSCSNSQ